MTEASIRSAKGKWKALLGFLVILSSLCVPAAYGAVIKDIRMWHAPERSRIVFDMDRHSDFNVFALENPTRVVIDLAQVEMKAKLPSPDSTGQFIRKIRKGSSGNRAVRLVFDIALPVRYFIRMLKPSHGHQYRLVVDFHPQNYDPESSVAPEPKPKKRKTDQDFLIIVDAGHGGEDPGALGKNSKEKDLVLQISRRLKKLIDDTPGMRAHMTRSGDYYVNLRERAAIARRKGADMFVSVHADAFTKPTARGASVYALSLRGATSETARLLARQQNLSDLAGGAELADKDPETKKVMLGMSMDMTIDQSVLFGREVLDELKKIGRIHSKRVEQAGFVVLKSPDVPSILVETGYITNPTEEKLLRSASHQKRVARAILNGINRYVTNNPGYFVQN